MIAQSVAERHPQCVKNGSKVRLSKHEANDYRNWKHPKQATTPSLKQGLFFAWLEELPNLTGQTAHGLYL